MEVTSTHPESWLQRLRRKWRSRWECRGVVLVVNGTKVKYAVIPGDTLTLTSATGEKIVIEVR
jgi:hypothetical protein